MASYVETAKKIPKVQERLDAVSDEQAKRAVLYDLLNDPVLGECAEAYFMDSNKPLVAEANGFHVYEGGNRRRIIAAQLAGVSVPVRSASKIVVGETYDVAHASVPDTNYGTPRHLSKTEQQWHKDAESGSAIYNDPISTGKTLYTSQGTAYENFGGTCGLCSCANILRLAGISVGEREMIQFAYPSGLCSYDEYIRGDSGGTSAVRRQKILAHFGISSSLVPVTFQGKSASEDSIRQLASFIEQGRGVIISVDAGKFYNKPNYNNSGHAVTVTSVRRSPSGEIEGFYICDSNHGTSFFPKNHIQKSLRDVAMNVTDTIIR